MGDTKRGGCHRLLRLGSGGGFLWGQKEMLLKLLKREIAALGNEKPQYPLSVKLKEKLKCDWRMQLQGSRSLEGGNNRVIFTFLFISLLQGCKYFKESGVSCAQLVELQ